MLDEVLLSVDVEVLLKLLVVEDVLGVEDVESVLEEVLLALDVLDVVDAAVVDDADLVGTIGGGSWNGVQGSEDMRSLAT